MSLKRNYSFLFKKLIILSFIFTIPSIQPLELHKQAAEKISQIESHSEVAVLKSTTESKLLKRIPFLETLINVDNNQVILKSILLSETFFDLKSINSSYDLRSALARAPPVLV